MQEAPVWNNNPAYDPDSLNAIDLTWSGIANEEKSRLLRDKALTKLNLLQCKLECESDPGKFQELMSQINSQIKVDGMIMTEDSVDTLACFWKLV